MIGFIWPWLLLLLPLPLLVRRWLPPVGTVGEGALKAPFLAELMAMQEASGGGVAGQGQGQGWLPLLLWALLLLSAAQPVWLDDDQPLPASGRDLMLLLDVSGSMRQMDFAREGELLNRLDLVKEVALRFVAGRHGDRLGLILFGEKPFLRAPLTWDRQVIGELIAEAQISLAGESTAIGDAIGLAIKRMRRLEAKSRVLVLVTDGANNEGYIDPRQAAHLAAGEGMRIYTIGIGRSDAPAPNPWGVWSTEHAARFEREMLEEMAAITGGRFFHTLDVQGLAEAWRALDELEPALDRGASNYLAKPLYPWTLLSALVPGLLLVSRPYRRRR